MSETLMRRATRLAALLCFLSALSSAASWSGTLVDSKCYDARERNVNPTDTLTSVDRDTNAEIRYCSPSAKTKSFAVVQSSGLSFRLDPAGNAQAAELVRKTGRNSRFAVAVNGEMNKNTVTVDSISLAGVRH
jgi:hypothetical protein